MGRDIAVRIVATNDFVGSFAPARTSYGQLPGGDGLRRAVNRLREGRPTIWADGGDFAQGGPLAPLSGGRLGFEAAAELGIDVAAVGNHEFDWGVDHLLAEAARLPFPLLCANASLPLPPTALLEAGGPGGVPVGFVGLTHPEAGVGSMFGPPTDPGLNSIVRSAAVDLRARGAEFVVVLLHEGVDWHMTSAGHVMDTNRLLALCRPWASMVDAIVAGHSLGRWIGDLTGVPIVQPWAYGSEVAVVELTRGSLATARAMMVDPGERWGGAGGEEIDQAEETVLGVTRRPMAMTARGDNSLLEFAAAALRSGAGTEAALVSPWEVGCYHQPALDGTFTRWPAGPITESDLLRAVPWLDQPALQAEFTAKEVERIGARYAVGPNPKPGFAADPSRGESQVVAMGRYTAHQVRQWIGRPVDWQPSAVGLREAVSEALAALR